MSRNDRESLLVEVAARLDPADLLRFFADLSNFWQAVADDPTSPFDVARAYRLNAHARHALGDATAPAWYALAEAAELDTHTQQIEGGT